MGKSTPQNSLLFWFCFLVYFLHCKLEEISSYTSYWKLVAYTEPLRVPKGLESHHPTSHAVFGIGAKGFYVSRLSLYS